MAAHHKADVKRAAALLSLCVLVVAAMAPPAAGAVHEKKLPPTCNWLPVHEFESQTKVDVTDRFKLARLAEKLRLVPCVVEFTDRKSAHEAGLIIEFIPSKSLDSWRRSSRPIEDIDDIGDECFIGLSGGTLTAFVRRGDAAGSIAFVPSDVWTPKRAHAIVLAAVRLVSERVEPL